jgi:hypothetical protein
MTDFTRGFSAACYSVLGRYRLLTGAATSALIVQAAFGNRAHAMSVVMPGRLQALAEGLPGNTTGDDLAAQGTVLPYFCGF